MQAPLLKLSGITRRYDSPGNAGSFTVLDGINLELQRGQSLAIVGPSGSGKSTLLQIIGTLDQPSAGQVLLNGQEISALDETQLAAVRNQQIGFVFQAHYLLPQCTVLENVLVPTLVNTDKAGRRSAALRGEQLLERVGLGGRKNHRPGELSGGERQRVAVVRALINQPQLLLADEPTGSLDHNSAQQLTHLLADLNREQSTALIVVTHSRELASQMSQVMELKDSHLTRID